MLILGFKTFVKRPLNMYMLNYAVLDTNLNDKLIFA